VRDGRALSLPCTDPLRVHPCRLEDGVVRIDSLDPELLTSWLTDHHVPARRVGGRMATFTVCPHCQKEYREERKDAESGRVSEPVRKALALSIDRTAIHEVMEQQTISIAKVMSQYLFIEEVALENNFILATVTSFTFRIKFYNKSIYRILSEFGLQMFEQNFSIFRSFQTFQ
jgi:hypothetical protein